MYDRTKTRQLLTILGKEVNTLTRLVELCPNEDYEARLAPVVAELASTREETPYQSERLTAVTLEARAKQLLERHRAYHVGNA